MGPAAPKEVAVTWRSLFSSSRRGHPISAVVIHDTESRSARSALEWFASAESRVSAHVVIDRDGTIYRVVPDELAAWHAGVSSLGTDQGLNAISLGVELVDADDNAGDPYPVAQFDAAVAWVAAACIRYNIPLNRVVGHDQVAPGRKHDPGPDFPWESFLLAVAQVIIEEAHS